MLSIDVLSVFVDLWLKPLVALWIALSFCRWSVARSPQTCHWSMLTLGFIALFFLPIAKILPPIQVEVYLFSEFATLFQSVGQLDGQWAMFALYSFSGAYFFVVILMLDAHGYDFFSARKIVNSAVLLKSSQRCELEIPANIGIKVSDEILSPVVWGFWRPTILLPGDWQNWQKGRLNRVLRHELAHIERHDWLIKNVLYVLRAWFWFLPAVWVLVQRAALYAEYACDDAVIASGISRSDYARDLLDLSSSAKLDSSFVAITGSELATRIHLVLDGNRDRNVVAQYQKIVTVVTALILILPFYCLSFVPRMVDSDAPTNLQILPFDRVVQAHKNTADIPLNILPIEESKARIPSDVVRHQFVASPLITPRDQVRAPEVDVETDIVYSPNFSVAVKGLVPDTLIYPQYPKRALVRGREANITVRFDVDKQGKVFNIEFPNSNKAEVVFHKAIVQALKESRFFSPVINGQPVVYEDAEEVFVFKIES